MIGADTSENHVTRDETVSPVSVGPDLLSMTGLAPHSPSKIAKSALGRSPLSGEKAMTETKSMTVRKRPIEVEAWQYQGADSLNDAPAWVREYRCQLWDSKRSTTVMHGIKPDISHFDCEWHLRIPTLEGVMVASTGDWLILGIKGEVYPCKPDIFEETYERVEASLP